MSIRFAADRRVESSGSQVPVGFYQEPRGVFHPPFLSTGKVLYRLKKPADEAEHVHSSFSPVQTTCRPSIPFRNVYLALFPKSRSSSGDFKMLDIVPSLLYLLHTLPSMSCPHACPYSGHLHPYR